MLTVFSVRQEWNFQVLLRPTLGLKGFNIKRTSHGPGSVRTSTTAFERDMPNCVTEAYGLNFAVLLHVCHIHVLARPSQQVFIQWRVVL
jgi:hypothetical protein